MSLEVDDDDAEDTPVELAGVFLFVVGACSSISAAWTDESPATRRPPPPAAGYHGIGYPGTI